MNQTLIRKTNLWKWTSLPLLLGIYMLSEHLPAAYYGELPLVMLSSQIVKISLGVDHLAVLLLIAVSILGSVVMAYANRYLLTDVTRRRFMVQLGLTMGSVLFFILSNNLFSAFIGWQWIGLNLYILLNHYHYQSPANRAAKKKFIINRLGDMSFLLAIVLCYQLYGTTEYTELALMPSVGLPIFGETLNGHTLILMLVFIAIMTKSAQFPFHIWLPDTMQTPTPVSALMHAGVINAGGILLARLSPLFSQASWLPYVMLFCGMGSLVVGALLKTVQVDIKKKLAYSTMSQMGYMLMQSAIGCFAAAVFHLIAHGFYKAALFLNAGNTLFEKELLIQNPQASSKITLFLSYSLVVISLIMTRALFPHAEIGIIIWAFIAVSLEQMLHTVMLQSGSFRLKVAMVVVIQAIVTSYVWLLTHFESQVMLPDVALINPNFQSIISILIIASYTAIRLIPQPALQKASLCRKVHGLLLEKLYIEEFYRTHLLDPLRQIGDKLNQWLVAQRLYRQAIFIVSISMPVIMLTIKTLDLPVVVGMCNIVASLAILIMLVIANRAKSLTDILQFLFASHAVILSIGILNNDSVWNLKHLSVLFAYCCVFAGLYWLTTHAGKSPLSKQKLVIENRLTVWGSYLAILLFLMIGIPGTASFTLWFHLIASLTANPFALLTLLMANVMLAIVVLHTLQDYVFNLQSTFELTATKKWKIHVVFASIIIINIGFGIFPEIIKGLS